jgi:hypothetical protein
MEIVIVLPSTFWTYLAPGVDGTPANVTVSPLKVISVNPTVWAASLGTHVPSMLSELRLQAVKVSVSIITAKTNVNIFFISISLKSISLYIHYG